MKATEVYVDLKGRRYTTADLDANERKLIDELQVRARKHPDWNDYSNYWMLRVTEFYAKQSLSKRQIRETALYRIAQDIGSRLAVNAGQARLPDYRDELEEIIREQFQTRREFCEATGLSEDMLSHVLSKRKHLAVDTLSEALGRIGYSLRLVPMKPATR